MRKITLFKIEYEGRPGKTPCGWYARVNDAQVFYEGSLWTTLWIAFRRFLSSESGT